MRVFSLVSYQGEICFLMVKRSRRISFRKQKEVQDEILAAAEFPADFEKK
jgi:hypothetical protein